MNSLNQTLLHSAVKSYDLEEAELLVREGVDIYCKDEKGLTPLHILIQKRVEMFDALHAAEVRLRSMSDSQINNEDSHAGDEGIEIQIDHAVQYLIDKYKRERTEFISITRNKIEENEKFIDMLLKHKNSNLNCVEDFKLLDLHAACTLRNSSVAERLLDQIVDINQSLDENSLICPGYTALHFAAHCNISLVKLLITKGANLLIQDAGGLTPLEICTKLYDFEEIQTIMNLLSAWRNILFSDGKTKLMDYVSSLSDPVVHKKFVQQIGKNIRISLPKDSPVWPGYTILHIVVFMLPESNLQILEDTLTQGVDVTIQDIHGSTPIHLAFRQNKLKVLKLLLKSHKKAVNPVDKDNLSHLHIATVVNRHPLAKKLLKSESDFNIVYTGRPLPAIKFGWTALHTAAHTKHSVIGKMLLQGGANLLQTDPRGFTAIHLLLGTTLTQKMAEVFFASDQLKECVVEGSGLTHLHVATWRSAPEAMERLLALGSDIEATIGQLEDEELKKFEGCRPIHIAMMDDSRFGVFQLLLRRGANILPSPLSELLTGKYDIKYLKPIIELLWSSEELQKRFEKELGLTMLHVVCYTVDIEKVEELLKKGIDINVKTRDNSIVWPGFTPLHVLTFAEINSSHNRWNDLFNLLLSKGADVNLANAQGDTAVHMAMKARSLDSGMSRAYFLMKHLPKFNVNPVNRAAMSYFHVACLLNDVKMVAEFLKLDSNIDINQAVNSDAKNDRFAGYTPLLMALSSASSEFYDAECQIKTVNLLLNSGADVKAVDAFGYTSLHKLSSCTSTRNLLLDKIFTDNVDINQRTTDGKTPLEILLWSGAPVSEVKYFVDKGAQINTYNHISDIGYMAIVLSKNAYKNSRDSDGIIEMMMHSADIAEVDETGRNAIHNAVAAECPHVDYEAVDCQEHENLIENLIEFGCNIFQQDSQGRTALHLAVKFQNLEAVKILLECGADVNIVDSTGKSPFSYATVFRKDKRSSVKSDSNAPICQILAEHVRTLQYIGLQVSKLNAKLLRSVVRERRDIEVKICEKNIDRALEFAEETKICNRGFTHRDFLYQTGIVNMYWSLKQADRDSIDLYFGPAYLKFNILEEYLKLQYRSARERSSLIAPGVEGLRRLLGFPLPDLCADIVLMYLTNLDIKNMSAATV